MSYIYGAFISKRGAMWSYKVYPNGSVEQYRHTLNGTNRGNDRYTKPTKECKEIIKQRHGIDAWSL